MKYLIFGLACLILVAAFIFASGYYRGRQAGDAGPVETSILARDQSPTLGSDDAKVDLVEFMDPACGACAAFSPFVKKLVDANPGRLRLVIRYAPFHEGSEEVVKMLEASRKQGKYWEALSVVFGTQRYWAGHPEPQIDKLWQFLARAGIDVERLRKDMNDPAIEALIAQDEEDVRRLNVEKTPDFFVNGVPLESFGYEPLHELVQSAIAESYPD